MVQSGKDVPNPGVFLGDLEDKEADQTTIRCLRATECYKDLITNFARCVSYSRSFDRDVKHLPISKILTPFLEAFLVLVYVNNHANWMKEAEQEDDESSETGSTPSPKLYGRFTHKSKGKYKGWNDEGIRLYNKLVQKIMQQRSDTRLGANFDADVKQIFLDKIGSTGANQQGSRPSVRAMNGISNWREYVEL